jgi:hypothetical protein
MASSKTSFVFLILHLLWHILFYARQTVKLTVPVIRYKQGLLDKWVHLVPGVVACVGKEHPVVCGNKAADVKTVCVLPAVSPPLVFLAFSLSRTYECHDSRQAVRHTYWCTELCGNDSAGSPWHTGYTSLQWHHPCTDTAPSFDCRSSPRRRLGGSHMLESKHGLVLAYW